MTRLGITKLWQKLQRIKLQSKKIRETPKDEIRKRRDSIHFAKCYQKKPIINVHFMQRFSK